jgi:hypothetical protein
VSDAGPSRPPPDPGERAPVAALPPLALEAPRPAPPATAIAVGFATARARILRRPTALSAVVGAALVVVAAIIERRVGSAGAVDRTLAATFNIVVPLAAFGVAAEASGRQNLRDAVWPAARYGLARRDVALGSAAAGMLASAALGAFFAALAVAAAHGEGNPPLAHDLFTSGWIAALVSAAYTGWFMAGATFGRRGGGRWVPLLLDFAIGASAGVAGAILPRAHAVSLLGGAAPMGMSQTSSSAALFASAAVLALAAALRCGA